MKQIIYTLTLSAALLGLSTVGTAKSGGDHGRNDNACEMQCEQKKDHCGALKSDDNVFQHCMAEMEQQCKQVCNQHPDDKDHDQNDRNHR